MAMALPNTATTRRSDLQAEKLAQTRATRLAQAAYGAELSSSQYAKPAGLINEGNTCFFNSTFQALAASRSLINLLAPVIVPTKSSTEATPGAEAAEKQKEEDDSTPQPPTPLVADPNISLHSPYPPVSVSTGAAADDPLSVIQITPHAIPSLRDEALEPDTSNLLPVTFAFERALGRAWKAKDAAVSALTHAEGEDSGAAAAAAAEQKALSLKSLLRELARKYDQYDEYRQQDAHELLRHLLDSMSMEEKDVIKKLRPAPTPEESGAGGTRPRGNRRRTRGDSISKAQVEMAGELGQLAEGSMVPFADALFGGSLVSVVICEGCKNVSHTYEGFLDVSLSMREAAPRPRKRDKFRAIANKLRPGSGSKSRSSQSQGEGRSEAENGGTSTPTINLDGVHSEAPSGDDSTLLDESALVDSASERSSVRDITPTPLQQPIPLQGAPPTSAVKKRSSLSWGIRKPSKSGRSSSVESSETRRSTADSGLEGSLSSLPAGPASGTATPRLPSGLSTVTAVDGGLADSQKPPRPTPAQAAYIRRILNGPNLPPKEDPLAKLRSGMAQLHAGGSNGALPGSSSGGHQLDQVPEEPAAATRTPTIDGLDTDLMDSLRTFTATEVLEGENAFACHRCWRYQTGRFKSSSKRASNTGGDDDDADEEEDEKSPMTTSTSAPAPSNDSGLERSNTDASASSAASAVPNITLDGGVLTEEPAPVPGEHRRRVRLPVDAVDEHSLVAPPARSHRPSSSSGLSTGSQDSNASTVSGSGYSTSSEDSSDEPGRARLTIARPPMPSRRKSTHFVMRRAVKRYMFARAPPILVFHFKRFTQSGKHAATSMYMSTFASLKKIDDFASFPEMLDLGPFVAPRRSDYKEPNPPTIMDSANPPRARYLDHPPGDRGPADPTPIKYRLYAVVVHVGASSLSGHYVAYVLVEPGAILKHLQPEHMQPSKEQGQVAAAAGEGRDATQCGPDVEADLMAEPSIAPNGESASKSSNGSNTETKKDTRVWCYCSE